jgi:hypothetical protein
MPRLQPVKDAASDQNFRTLEKQFPIQSQDVAESVKELFPQLVTAGSHKVAFGVSVCGWTPGAHLSNVTEVSHGLKDDKGKAIVPTVVLCTAISSESETHVGIFNVISWTTTIFNVNAYWPNGTGPGNNSFAWIAIS